MAYKQDTVSTAHTCTHRLVARFGEVTVHLTVSDPSDSTLTPWMFAEGCSAMEAIAATFNATPDTWITTLDDHRVHTNVRTETRLAPGEAVAVIPACGNPDSEEWSHVA